jgi:hypothetical protein
MPEQNARELARTALFRARYRFENGQPKAGLDDVFATVRLARHIGAEGGVISHIIERSVETMAVQTAAAHVWAMSEPELCRDFLRRWDALPRTTGAADAIRTEGEWLAERLITRGADFPGDPEPDLLGRTPDRLRQNRFGTKVYQLGLQTEAASIRQFVTAARREASRATANARLPLDQIQNAEVSHEADILKNAAGDDPNVRMYVTAAMYPVYGMRLKDERGHVARAMLRAAVAAHLRGDDTPAEDDPHGTGTFLRTPTPTGYELRTRLNDRLAEAEKAHVRCGGPLVLAVHTKQPKF